MVLLTTVLYVIAAYSAFAVCIVGWIMVEEFVWGLSPGQSSFAPVAVVLYLPFALLFALLQGLLDFFDHLSEINKAFRTLAFQIVLLSIPLLSFLACWNLAGCTRRRAKLLREQ